MKRREKKKKTHYLVLDNKGEIADFSLDKLGPGLKSWAAVVDKKKNSFNFSNRINEMIKLELVDYEPASDKGHFRFYPKGSLIRNLIKEWLEKISLEEFQALPVRTPFLYRKDEEDIKGQINGFADRIYDVSTPKESRIFCLKFGGDPGAFKILRDAKLSYKNLPLRVYENAVSFRYNLSGELSGIVKARNFSFPDLHSICGSLKQATDEYRKAIELQFGIARSIGINPEILLITNEYFYNLQKKEIAKIASSLKSKVLIKILRKPNSNWTMKSIIFTEHPHKLFHTQLDFNNPKRYKINYISRKGNKEDCVIVHISLGSIEKWMEIFIENAFLENVPQFPLWLSPTQVRIIPVNEEKHLNFCVDLARKLKENQIRVNVDDRSKSLSRKIRSAEKEWIPYIIVCGDKEIGSRLLPVRVRGKSQKRIELGELISSLKKETESMPFKPLPGLLVSRKPIFNGYN